MTTLVYQHTTELTLNNLTACLEREIRQEFNAERAMTISMFMHGMEELGHDFSSYQDTMWLELTRLIEDNK